MLIQCVTQVHFSKRAHHRNNVFAHKFKVDTSGQYTREDDHRHVHTDEETARERWRFIQAPHQPRGAMSSGSHGTGSV